MFGFGRETISAKQAADLFIHDMAIMASDTFDGYHRNVLHALRMAGGNEHAEYDMDKNNMGILYFLMITALNAAAVNNLFGETDRQSLFSAIESSLSEATGVESVDSATPDIYGRYLDAIRSGIEGIKTGNPLLPHDAVAGLFVKDMKLHQYEGVLTGMGEGTFINPTFLMFISAPLVDTIGWWKALKESYKIK